MSAAGNYPFTAHPKVHPETGVLHYYGYQLDAPPHCMYGQLDPNGKRTVWFEIPLRGPIFMHDFGLTEDYAVFIDHPVMFDPMVIVT